MRIVRGSTVYVVQILQPYLLESPEGGSIETYAAELRQLLAEAPDRSFILMALDESDGVIEVKAFLIAYMPEGVNYVVLSQAWADPKLGDNNVSELFFLRLISWASNHGKDQIRMLTARDPAALERRWGFKTIARTMALDIGDEFEMAVLETIRNRRKGDDNGIKQSEEHKQPELGTEVDRPVAGTVSSGEDRPECGVVSGGDSSGTDPAVSASPADAGELQPEQREAGSEHGLEPHPLG